MDTRHRTILRIPKGLYRRVTAEAKRQKRSANAVMLIGLNDYLERRDLDRRWDESEKRRAAEQKVTP